MLDGLAQVLFRHIVVAQLEVGPAQRIQIGAILRIELHGLLDVSQGFFEADATVGQHVAQIVQGDGVVGMLCKTFLKVSSP